jgi:hypothetical protein
VTAYRLPVSGIDVSVQLPTGAEDVLLVEEGTPSVALAIALLSRVAYRLDGEQIDWAALVPTDVDVLLLLLRQRVLGDIITADVFCAAADCHARVDITFSISGFIAHHRPHTPQLLRAADDDGWFRLDESDLEFRLPRAADQIAIALEPEPELSLMRRCIRAEQITPLVREHVEAAMEALAPSLFSELQGVCPECGGTVSAAFDPLLYTLRELRDQAGYVYEDVCAIARHTHWSEADILALPTARRHRYAELAQELAAI